MANAKSYVHFAYNSVLVVLFNSLLMHVLMYGCLCLYVHVSVCGIFNGRTDVDEWDCTQGLYGHRKTDSGRKILCRTGDSNPRQYCAWPFSQPLYQLSCPRPWRLLIVRVSTRAVVVVVVVRELFSLVTSSICVRIRGRGQRLRRLFTWWLKFFVYCCVLTTVNS